MPKFVTSLKSLHKNQCIVVVFLTAISLATGEVCATSLYDGIPLNLRSSVGMDCAPMSRELTFSEFLKTFSAQSAKVDTRNWSRDIFSRLSLKNDREKGGNTAEFTTNRARVQMDSIQGLSASAVLGVSKTAVEVFSNRIASNGNEGFSGSAVVINRRYALVGIFVTAFHDVPVMFFCADNKSNQIEYDAESLENVLKSNAGEIQAGVETLLSTLTEDQLLSVDQMTQADARNAATIFPNLHNVLQSTGLYDISSGALISGEDVSAIGKTIVVSAAAIQAFRLLTMGITKNPALAAIVFPLQDTKGMAIDLKSTAMTLDEVKSFLGQSGALQRQLCQQDPKVKTLCKILSAIEFEAAYAQGNGA